jgi:2-polyprenyl-3-methyl-5-hydroxy-6-metoxy-1,4-benzoquinol methylase
MRIARRRSSHEQVFRDIFRRGLFGGTESRSGPGSGVARTERLRAELPRLLEELTASVLLDAGCGDCHWMSRVDLSGIKYVGIDVVPELIVMNRRHHARPGWSFDIGDVTRDPLPRADVILCRDCLIHLPDEDVLRALANFRRSGATHLITTTFQGNANRALSALGYGWRPLNLEAPPFSLGAPVRTLVDAPSVGYPDKRLGIWCCDALPDRST